MTTENQPQEETRLALLIKQPNIQDRFKEVLGARTATFISSVMSAYKGNKKLSECEPMSVIASAMIAATMNLSINQNLGFAHIVPYDGKAQFQMGWKGFVQLALRTGQYRTMNVAVVYEGELQSHNRITGDIVIDPTKKSSDKVIGYVAFFRLISGFEKYLFMTAEEVLAHAKKYSASFKAKKGLWVDDFEAMALKTVIKMLLNKWGILSVEMEKAMTLDQGIVIDMEGNTVYPDNPDGATDGRPTGNGGPSRLKKAIEGQSGTASGQEAAI